MLDLALMTTLMLAHTLLHNLDEHYFNKKRPHQRYELLSVISDGVLFLIPIVIATFVNFHEQWVPLYKLVAGLSMLSIIKNEFFYDNLRRSERMIHAALYVLHPMLLFTFYESWRNNFFDQYPNFWMFQLLYVGLGIKTVTYQIIYWNYIHEKKDHP